ncbi:MAG: peptidylprolyl isomerase [Bryobacteraceae bacterium]|jgi:parvulin-like peptidyl-prolyl isomerase
MSSRNWLAGAASGISLLFAFQLTLAAADRPDPQTHVIEEIVAKVNGKIITRGDLERQRERIAIDFEKQGFSGAALENAVNKAAADALKDQIDQLLLVAKGDELNINVDSDVTKRIAEIQKQSGIADQDKFHDWVREQSGESFEDLKQLFKNQFMTQRVIGEEVYRNVNIPKADIQKYYDEHKKDFVRKESVTLREIFISCDNAAKCATAEKKAKDIVDRLHKGEKFPDMVRLYSENAETVKDEGVLGNFTRGQLAGPIEDVVFKQSRNYVTDPIRTATGFEILKVEEHTPDGQATLDEVEGQINNILSEPIVGPKLRVYLTQLRENAFLQIKDGYVDTGAAPDKDTSWKDPAQLKAQTITKEAVANQRHLKKFLKVIPYGMTGEKDTGEAAPPEETPIPTKPVENADSSPNK